MRHRRRVAFALALSLLAGTLAFLAAPVRPAAAAGPPVSAIGDSTLLGMTSSSRAIVDSGYNFLWEAKSCRRLIITSCRGGGVVPANTLQTMQASAGRLGDAVAIMAGYDDWYAFDVAVDAIVAEARRQGIGHVIWLTYRSQGPYVGVGGAYFATYRSFNTILAAKARQHPELIIADWDGYTLGQASWFSPDGIHLSAAGATALGSFLRAQYDRLGLQRCYGSFSGAASAPPTPAPITQSAPGRFTSANIRVLDTRPDPADNVANPLGWGQVVSIPLVARDIVPGGSTAVMVNVTGVSSCRNAFVTAFPCGGQVPLASNLNLLAGRTRAALATVQLSPGGELCVYTMAPMDLVVDVFGWFGPNDGLLLNPVAPDRFLDTRDAAAARNPRVGKIGPGAFPMQVAGLGPVPAGARAVLVNVTAVDPNADGYITVHPCNQAPWVSNVNFRLGQIVANLAVVGLDGAGRACLTANTPTHAIVDVVGWFGGSGLQVRAQTPERVMDTRDGHGGVTGPLPTGGIAQLAVPGQGMLATVTAVFPTGGPGFVTAYPCPNRPTASNLNYVAGDVVPNLALVSPGAGGNGCLFTQRPADLVVDRAATLVA